MSMEKTIKEWIGLCTNETVKERWTKNYIDNHCKNKYIKFLSMSDALCSYESFNWAASEEGHHYWEAIYKDMERNPTKYLKKKKVMFIYE